MCIRDRSGIDGGVAAFAIARIFGVPIGEQHHQNLEAIQFVGADKRVVRPRPVQPFDTGHLLGLMQLEASILELALLVDK